MKILVTGHKGFIGGHVYHYLRHWGGYGELVDGMGTDEFLKIIRYVIKDTNVFVISHKPDMNDKFESMIKFEKIKGFSHMAS